MPWDCCSTCAKYGSGACDDNVVMNYSKETEMLMPAPECELGYPEAQLKEIFSEDQFKMFLSLMRGQTFGFCDGSYYDHQEQRSISTGCGPHKFVYYSWDVERFLDNKPVID